MGSIELALEDLKLQKRLNYAATARSHDVDETTLRRRHKGITDSKAAYDQRRGLLTTRQEEELINSINRLSERSTPPTVNMVQIFAAQISKKEPGVNWANHFIKRHRDRISSVMLRGYDASRKQADSVEELKSYFDLVHFPPPSNNTD